MNFVECVQVITQIVTAVTAVVMAWLAYVTYLQPPEQSSEDEPEEAFTDETGGTLTSILVFKTSKQETWLSVSDHGLNCRIEDTREGKGGPQWHLNKAQLVEILKANAYRINSGYKAKTGTFTIGPKRNWLYSKALFPEPDYLHGVLTQLLENAST